MERILVRQVGERSYAGVYNEKVTPAHAGSASSPITFSTNPGDPGAVQGFNLSYITITGTAANPLIITQAWSAINNSIFQYINNTSGYGAPSLSFDAMERRSRNVSGFLWTA
jgi:hypothetical protein